MAAAAAALKRRSYWGSKIVAIGKNYSKHKVEMGGTPERLSEPMFFFKPSSSVIPPSASIVRPAGCTSLHHEVELGLVIRGPAKNVAKEDWETVVGGWVLALDMTARDWQADAKKKGWPWSLAKGCDTFCPMSEVLPPEAVEDPYGLQLRLAVDGEERQCGPTSDMLHKMDELVEYVTSVVTLEDGDVILTGTPEGVGAVEPGSTMTSSLETGAGEVLLSMETPVISE